MSADQDFDTLEWRRAIAILAILKPLSFNQRLDTLARVVRVYTQTDGTLEVK